MKFPISSPGPLTMRPAKPFTRVFVLVLMALISIDAWPPQSWCVSIKRPVARIMDSVGLRQGTWAMFTPNPVINNRWISADMKTVDGQVLHWDSPVWSSSSTWDQFVRFRHINFYNRVYQSWCMPGHDDFMHSVARQSGEDLQSIQLHLNRMDLIMPEDGTLPFREEAEWRLISEPWIGETQAQ